MMEGAEGALTPNRLICCQTTNATFDVVWFLFTEVVSLSMVIECSGSKNTFYDVCVPKHYASILETEKYVHGSVGVYSQGNSCYVPNICKASSTITQKVAETPHTDQINAGKPKQKPSQTGFRGSFTVETPPQNMYLTGMKPLLIQLTEVKSAAR